MRNFNKPDQDLYSDDEESIMAIDMNNGVQIIEVALALDLSDDDDDDDGDGDGNGDEDNEQDEDSNPSEVSVNDGTDVSLSDEDMDSDDSDDSDVDAEAFAGAHNDGPSSRRTGSSNKRDVVEDIDEEDDVVRAIMAASKLERSHPPDIQLDEFIAGLSFHPEKNVLAVAGITGDVMMYEYSNEENKLLGKYDVHPKAIRAIEFQLDGSSYVTASKDKSIVITDTETGKPVQSRVNAHESSLYALNVFSENMFASGDENGTVKVWDTRCNEAVFGLKEVDDFISCILTNDAKKVLLMTSGDGYLTSINIGARKLYVQSEQYEEELTSMGLFRNDTKLVVGTSKGRMYSFKWDEFGLHSDMYPGPKSGINAMVPVTDRIAVVAGEEGVLRAMHVLPGKMLGVVGQHSMGVENIDISGNGEIIASCSQDSDIRFWNIKYFEDFDDIKYSTKANLPRELRHNLKSSKVSNASDFFADMA